MGCKSINELVSRILTKIKVETASRDPSPVPEPVKHDPEALRPLSHSQQRLWFLHKFLPDKTVHNLLLVCHIEGVVQPDLLRQTWQTLLDRHEVLRSHISGSVDGRLQQLPVSGLQLELETLEVDEADFLQKVQELTGIARSYEFNLDGGELIRCWLLRSSRQARFFLASHHLAWDRTSTAVVFDEITAIYKSLLAGEAPESNLEPVSYQFVDFANWQNRCIETPQLKDPLVKYWRDQLSGIPDSASLLPVAHSDRRPAVKQLSTQTVKMRLDASLEAAIKDFCASQAVTPFMFLTSAVSALIFRLTGDEDVVVGIADGDRGHSAFDRLVGFAVNMLPIRSRVRGEMDFLDFLEQFRLTCLGAYEHRLLPFDYLLQSLDVSRNTAHSPVFQVTVNYQVHGSFKEADFGAFKFVDYDHYNARGQSDFGIDIEETADGALDCVIEFDTAIYDAEGMHEFSEMYRSFIRGVVEARGCVRLDSVKLVSPEDESRITSILQPQHDSETIRLCNELLFDKLFQQSVKDHSDKIAVMDDAQQLTFEALDKATNIIANKLIREGAQVGDAVGVYCESGVDLVVSIYGILKAGCAYTGIQDAPEERLRSMIEDVGMERVLVDNTGNRAQEMIACGLKARNVFRIRDVLADPMARAATPELSRPLQSDDNLCCIFTSGSTGRPKGIFLQHGRVRLWQHGYHGTLGTTADDTLLLASASTFDMSLVSLYASIAYGATMVVASREGMCIPPATRQSLG